MRNKNYYLILDTETATLPFSDKLAKNAKDKQSIAIAKPLIYNIGWVVADSQGNIIDRQEFLIQETFFVPQVFNTAYYKEKRPIYMKKLADNAIKVATWNEIVELLIQYLNNVTMSTAFNACFDFKKAIPFTEQYINALYSDSYNEWEKRQYWDCKQILNKSKNRKNPDYLTPRLKLRDKEYPIFDLWGIACDRLINIPKYKNYCINNQYLTNSAMFFKTSAEIVFRYLTQNEDFEEEHTALNDSEIEAFILAKCLKKGKIEQPIIKEFPFRQLGETGDYLDVCAKSKKVYFAEQILDMLNKYMDTQTNIDTSFGYWARVMKLYNKLNRIVDPTFEPEEEKKSEKVLVFDMDGTIVDFYSVEDWLNCLMNEDATPYKVAEPMIDMTEFVKCLNQLKNLGWRIAVTSWLSKDATPEFKKEIRKAKQNWLEKYSIPVDETHFVKYGTPKQYCTKGKYQILFDDDDEVCKRFQKMDSKVERKTINPKDCDLLDSLHKLINEYSSAIG